MQTTSGFRTRRFVRDEAAVDRGGGDAVAAEVALDARPHGASAVSGLTAVSVLATSAFVAPGVHAPARRPLDVRPRGDAAARVKSNTKTQRGTPRPVGLGGLQITGEYAKPIETAASSPRPLDRETVQELAAVRPPAEAVAPPPPSSRATRPVEPISPGEAATMIARAEPSAPPRAQPDAPIRARPPVALRSWDHLAEDRPAPTAGPATGVWVVTTLLALLLAGILAMLIAGV